jgi:hypothetical protein
MPLGQPPQVLICCAEALRPMACVVVDALVVRGFSVTLLSGPNARAALRLSMETPARALRVLCLPRELDRRTHRRLLRNLGGDVRDDLLVVPMLTPRTVIDAIEMRAGIRRSRPRRRFTRAYLPHPTVSESKADPKRWVGYGALAFTATAAFALVVGGAELTAITVPAASISAIDLDPPRPADEHPSLLLDDAVHAAVRIPVTEDDDPTPRDFRRPKRPRRNETEIAAPPPPEAMDVAPPDEEEEVIIIEDDEEPVVVEVEAATHDEVLTLLADPKPSIPAEGVVAAPKPFVRVGKRRFVPRRTTLRPVDPFEDSL